MEMQRGGGEGGGGVSPESRLRLRFADPHFEIGSKIFPADLHHDLHPQSDTVHLRQAQNKNKKIINSCRLYAERTEVAVAQGNGVTGVGTGLIPSLNVYST